jgi:hypothetical protein
MKESNQNSWWNKLECCRSAEDWYLQNNGIYGYKYIYTELSYGLSCSEVCGEEWLALVDNYKCQDFFCNQKITSCSDCMEKFPEASEACCLMANHKCALDCVWQHEEEEGSICASP